LFKKKSKVLKSPGTEDDLVRLNPANKMTAAMPTTSNAAEDDLTLIQAFKNGDEAAFTQLVLKYQQQVFDLLFHYSGRRVDLEDMAQEVFIKVYTNLARFETRASFRTWLYRITLNVSIDHARKRKLRRMLSLDGLTEWAREQISLKSAQAPSPQVAAEQSDLAHYIQRGLEHLPDDFRRVLVLRDMEQLEYEEIAAITGWNLGTVKSRLFRARHKLKNFLKPYMEKAE